MKFYDTIECEILWYYTYLECYEIQCHVYIDTVTNNWVEDKITGDRLSTSRWQY